MRPRKYFWATMLVAFCDQRLRELDPALLERRALRIADHGVADLPLDGVERAHAGLRKAPPHTDPITGRGDGWGGGVTAVGHDLSSCGRLVGTPQGGKTDTAPRVGRTPDRPPAAADRRPGGGRPGSAGRSRPPRRGRRDCGRRRRTGCPTTGSSWASPRSARSPIWLASTSGPDRLTAAAIDSDRCSSCSELTGRLLAARSSPPRSFWLSNRSRRPSRLRTVTFVSARSYVVKRLPQPSHSRRRRTASPASRVVDHTGGVGFAVRAMHTRQFYYL